MVAIVVCSYVCTYVNKIFLVMHFCHYVANERPYMKRLHRYLTDYCEFWRPTGLNLGLESSVLGLIEANNLHQQRKCFRKTLERWLQQDVQATWYKLELAITNAKREFHGYDALDASMFSVIHPSGHISNLYIYIIIILLLGPNQLILLNLKKTTTHVIAICQ